MNQSLNAVDSICSPISNQIIQFTQENYPHLHGLELADNSPDSAEKLCRLCLIGADFYWHFLTAETLRDVTSGPVAFLGYVLAVYENVVYSSQVSKRHEY